MRDTTESYERDCRRPGRFTWVSPSSLPFTLTDDACFGNRTARAKRRGWVEPFSPNSFRDVVEKGLVSDAEARELYHIFFSGCHLFIPLFDASYDTYEALKERSPWCFNAVLAVASKIRAGNGPPSVTFYKCLEEAQGIARSTLFGPVVRKEAVQAMLLLAAWSTNGWLPCGHALRMGLDLELHLALERLADSGPKRRSEEEERHLVVSARTWLCIYWFDHQCVYVLQGISRSRRLTGARRMSLGTGRPILLKDESSIRRCRTLLTHPMTSPSDLRLIAQIELIAQKSEWLVPCGPARWTNCVPSPHLRDALPGEREDQPCHSIFHPPCQCCPR